MNSSPPGITAQASELEQLRRGAFAIAYRMLGSVSEAEDVVRVARTLFAWMRMLDRIPAAELRPVEVNGGAGVMVLDGRARLISVWSLDIAGGQIHGIRSVVNPDKLAHLGALADFTSLIGALRQKRATSTNRQIKETTND